MAVRAMIEVFSLYWDNIDPQMVEYQRAVCQKFGMRVQQHRIDRMEHGAWMDWVLARWTKADVVLFLDIDCIPLSRDWEREYTGLLTGAEGAANHIDPTRSYAAPWFLFVPHLEWRMLGCPSAGAHRDADVGQEFTETWRRHEIPLKLIPPTHVERPFWDLPGRPKAYGIGTTYGTSCYHQFESRAGSAPFIAKCKEVLGAQTI